MSSHIVLPDGLVDGAVGLIVWWELSGIVDYEDLADTWAAAGFPDQELPPRTSPEVALARAADAALTGKRQLCRPLTRRGSWEVVFERVTTDPNNNEKLDWKPIVQGWIQKDNIAITKQPYVRVIDEDIGPALRDSILGQYDFYQRTLLTVDVSYWLLGLLAGPMLNATALRSKGGFYFVPSDKVDTWRLISKVAQSVGTNVLYEIPAMRTESAVDAVLAQVKAEAQMQLSSMQDYLKGEISTKGLNATERHAARLREKLQNYIDTLGVALPELTDWCQQITGAVQAAHIIRSVKTDV